MTMRDLVVSLFGEYASVPVTVSLPVNLSVPVIDFELGTTYILNLDMTNAFLRFSLPDFQWFAKVILFSVCLWCFFRILGGIFKRL